MKKLVLFAVAALSMSFVACGGGEKADKAADSAAADPAVEAVVPADSAAAPADSAAAPADSAKAETAPADSAK